MLLTFVLVPMPASAVDSDEYLIYPIPHSITYDGGSSLLRTTASVAGNTSVEDFLAAKGAFEEARAGLTAKPTPPTHTRGFLLDTNGDGVGDLVSLFGLRRGSEFYLKNSNTGGMADVTITMGTSGDTALVGDFNGDGVTDLAVHK